MSITTIDFVTGIIGSWYFEMVDMAEVVDSREPHATLSTPNSQSTLNENHQSDNMSHDRNEKDAAVPENESLEKNVEPSKPTGPPPPPNGGLTAW